MLINNAILKVLSQKCKQFFPRPQFSNLSTRAQRGSYRGQKLGFQGVGRVRKLDFQAMVKMATSVASPKTKYRDQALGEFRLATRLADDRDGALPWSFVPWIWFWGITCETTIEHFFHQSIIIQPF